MTIEAKRAMLKLLLELAESDKKTAHPKMLYLKEVKRNFESDGSQLSESDLPDPEQAVAYLKKGEDVLRRQFLYMAYEMVAMAGKPTLKVREKFEELEELLEA